MVKALDSQTRAGWTRAPSADGTPEEDALRLAEEVVERAIGIGATEAEALVQVEDSALTRFANSEIHQNVAEANRSVNLRFVVGKRIAVLSTARTDEEGLRTLVRRASGVARTCEEYDEWAGLPSADESAPTRPSVRAWSPATADATPEFRADAVRAVIAAADEAGVAAYGSFSTGVEAVAVAN